MVNIFRNIRKHLIKDGRKRRYIRYALGEITLVVIGILIALQVNNWNENRKQKLHFQVLLGQIYNSINIDTEGNRYFYENMQEQIQLINDFLEDPSKIPDNKLIHILFYLDLLPEGLKSNTDNLLQFLDYGSNNEEQNEITEQLVAYNGFIIESIRTDPVIKKETIAPLLVKADIPRPVSVFGLWSFQDFGFIDTKFYDEQDINDAKKIMQTRAFISQIKSLRSKKENISIAIINAIEEGTNYLDLIKNYDNEVHFLFYNIGILGTALDSGWTKSVPMTLTDLQNSIWEIDLYLKDGYVKFRNRESWTNNWGGKGFPNGETLFNGKDIPVKEGMYHITLNLTAREYTFDKIK